MNLALTTFGTYLHREGELFVINVPKHDKQEISSRKVRSIFITTGASLSTDAIQLAIANNNSRGKVAKRCKEAGLYRVQKSVFLGSIERNRLDELAMQIEELIDEQTDSVYVFPLCQADFKKVQTMGQAFDEDLVTDEVRVLFL